MENENVNQGQTPVAAEQQPQSAPPPAAQPAMPVEQTPVEKMASEAYAHSSEMADALRRGELMRNSAVDPLADSDDRLIALLSYVTQILIPVIMPIIVLLSESSKKRPFQRYHAVQSLAFAAVFWSLMAFMGIGSAIISIIPLLGVLIGFMVMFCVVPIAWFASVVMLFYYGVQAYKGRRFAIPGLTSFLQDQGWL